MTEPLEAGDQLEDFAAVYARHNRDVLPYCLVAGANGAAPVPCWAERGSLMSASLAP